VSRPSWDILICSVEHRTDQLAGLLAELALQMVPGVGVRIFRDNLQTGYGEKCDALLKSSSAEYVSMLDDDDWIASDFVARIVAALESKPDYVGFAVRYTEDGVYQIPVIHSLEFEGWHDFPHILRRDIVHFNPLRRELALLGQWEGGNGADRRWAAGVRGHAKTQVYIPSEVYEYRHTSADTFLASSTREPLTEHPPRPEWPWAVYIDA